MKIDYVWEPSIRVMLKSDDGREYEGLPWGMWMCEELTEAQQMSIAKTGYMKARQCRAFWQYLGRTDKVPKRLTVLFSREDVMRIFKD
jgi:hypothetical protein